MKVFTYNADARIAAAKAVLEAKQSTARIHLLPIPSKAFLENEAYPALLENLSSGDLACGYGIPAEMKNEILLRGGRVFEEEEDTIFINENARLTAEVTLGYILGGARVPADLTVGIIGYGRIGRALCRMLLFFGANVRVYTERAAVRTELGAAGIESRPICYETGADLDLSGLDLLIQTAPVKIFVKENAPACPLWNLAAATYISEGVTARQLSALPAKVCFESGGKALARAVLRALQDIERKTL